MKNCNKLLQKYMKNRLKKKWSWSQIYDQIRKGQRKECVGTSEASRRNKPTEKGVRTIIMYKEILRIEKPR